MTLRVRVDNEVDGVAFDVYNSFDTVWNSYTLFHSQRH